MPNLQLEGEVDTRDEELVDARNKIVDLQHQLEGARMELAHARELSKHAVGKLRHVLNPLYEALKIIYGEMDMISPVGSTGIDAGSSSNPRLEAAKRSLPGNPAKFIGLLETHGTMNVTQFVTLAKCGKQTVYNTMSVLLRAGIVQNDGGRYSLKV